MTSRPEGITLPLYVTNFAIFSLRPLTESQQRRVAQSQMRGSAFYEHLVGFTTCRQKQDAAWLEHIPTEQTRGKLEGLEFVAEEPITPRSSGTTPPASLAAFAPDAVDPEADGGGEQTAIDMLDHVIRTVSAEAGMESDFIDDAISWLDESQGWSVPSLEKLVEQLEVQAFARLEVNAKCALVYPGTLHRWSGRVPGSERLLCFAHLQILHMHNRMGAFDPTHTRDCLCCRSCRTAARLLPVRCRWSTWR